MKTKRALFFGGGGGLFYILKSLLDIFLLILNTHV
jgi:hypothetical protein